jgi:hypothetical protein
VLGALIIQTLVAPDRLCEYSDVDCTDANSLLRSINYVCTVFTTIGYGTLNTSVPVWQSRLFTIFYAILGQSAHANDSSNLGVSVGIPAMALVMKSIGKFLARAFWYIQNKLRARTGSGTDSAIPAHNTHDDMHNFPQSVRRRIARASGGKAGGCVDNNRMDNARRQSLLCVVH